MQKVPRRVEGLLLFCLCALAIGLVAHGVGLAATIVNAGRGFAPNDACVGNVRLLSLAIVQYEQDFDQVLPPMHTQQEFQTALLPYVKDPTRFICPDTGLAYVPNPTISGKFIGSFASPDTTEALRDAKPHEDGRSTVLFLDGHVERGGVEQGDPNALRFVHARAHSLAVIQYTQDWDEKYPPTDTQPRFEAAVYGYARSHQAFIDPVNRKAFVPNPAISGISLASINDPSTTEVFRDDHPYPNGIPVIGYADGHVTPSPPTRFASHADSSDMKQLGLAVTFYTQDNNEYLPPTDDYGQFENALLPYVQGRTALFVTPGTNLPYVLNPAISGQPLGSIPDPTHTEILHDPQHFSDGVFNTLYVDGHVQSDLFYVPKTLAIGPDNDTHLLWPKALDLGNGPQASLGVLSPMGATLSLTPYSLDMGGSAFSLSVGGDNKTRLLWGNPQPTGPIFSNGGVTLETIAADGTVESSIPYGPYDGWTPLLIAAGSDDGSRLLWRRYDGTLALWTVSPQGQYLGDVRLWPSPTFKAVGLARGADGRTRLLLREPSGAAVLETLSTDSVVQHITHDRAEAGFAIVALALGSDSRPRLLFDNGQGQAQVWTLSVDGGYQSRVSFALPVGDAVQSLGVGQAGDLRVLSTASDGSGVLQTLTAAGVQTGSTVLTPYQ